MKLFVFVAAITLMISGLHFSQTTEDEDLNVNPCNPDIQKCT